MAMAIDNHNSLPDRKIRMTPSPAAESPCLEVEPQRQTKREYSRARWVRQGDSVIGVTGKKERPCRFGQERQVEARGVEPLFPRCDRGVLPLHHAPVHMERDYNASSVGGNGKFFGEAEEGGSPGCRAGQSGFFVDRRCVKLIKIAMPMGR